MEIDKSVLKKIGALSDDSLREAISGVAVGMGLDPKLTAMYLSDMGKIKETVMGLTDSDLKRIEKSLGEENTKALMEKIRNETEGK